MDAAEDVAGADALRDAGEAPVQEVEDVAALRAIPRHYAALCPAVHKCFDRHAVHLPSDDAIPQAQSRFTWRIKVDTHCLG